MDTVSPLDCSSALAALMPMEGMSTVQAMKKERGLSTYQAAGLLMDSAPPSAMSGCGLVALSTASTVYLGEGLDV